jgi:hypothetical protein
MLIMPVPMTALVLRAFVLVFVQDLHHDGMQPGWP